MQGNFEYTSLNKAEVEFFEKNIKKLPVRAFTENLNKDLDLTEELNGIDFLVTKAEEFLRSMGVGDIPSQGPIYAVKPKKRIVEYEGTTFKKENERVKTILLHSNRNFVYLEHPEGFFVHLYFDPSSEIID